MGSLNLDPRSVHENTEIGVVLTSPELGARIGPRLDEIVDQVAYRLELETAPQGYERIVWHEAGNGDGGRIHYSEPNSGFWKQFGVVFMSLLPVASQL